MIRTATSALVSRVLCTAAITAQPAPGLSLTRGGRASRVGEPRGPRSPGSCLLQAERWQAEAGLSGRRALCLVAGGAHCVPLGARRSRTGLPRQQPEGLGSALRVPAGGVRFSPPSPPFSSLHEPQTCFTERAGVTGILARARPRVWVVAVCHSALLEVICIILWGDG